MKLRVIVLSAIVILVATSTAMSQYPQPGPPRQPVPARPEAQPSHSLAPQEPASRPDPQQPRPVGPTEPMSAPASRPEPQAPQAAGPHGPVPAPAAPDPIAENLFPPELVMQYRRELALSDEQKAFIRDESIAASTRFNQLQWQMQDEVEKMTSLMKATNIDEQKVITELDKILEIEREVKRTQLRLSVRIKNKLNPEQQMKLQEFRRFPPPR